MFQANINSQQLDDLPIKVFEGGIVVIDSANKVKPAVEYLSKSMLLGFDTETRPSFVKGRKHKVALLQLANEERAYLFRLGNTGITDDLAALLENNSIMKVGAAIRDDLKALQKLRQFAPAGFIDLQSIAKKYGIMEMSVRKLAAIVLKIRISKTQQLSNWENAELTEAQQRYAATDAWVCRQAYLNLQNSL
ncbi:MAG: 3'-5' exonuclease domain-containing protein 2 [Prevotellaceae bacterium]|jgi:ribonuclease D|nr:3'-5' exonuclease domain-containing protein 2 [Prevotellaceae bacterium]